MAENKTANSVNSPTDISRPLRPITPDKRWVGVVPQENINPLRERLDIDQAAKEAREFTRLSHGDTDPGGPLARQYDELTRDEYLGRSQGEKAWRDAIDPTIRNERERIYEARKENHELSLKAAKWEEYLANKKEIDTERNRLLERAVAASEHEEEVREEARELRESGLTLADRRRAKTREEKPDESPERRVYFAGKTDIANAHAEYKAAVQALERFDKENIPDEILEGERRIVQVHNAEIDFSRGKATPEAIDLLIREGKIHESDLRKGKGDFAGEYEMWQEYRMSQEGKAEQPSEIKKVYEKLVSRWMKVVNGRENVEIGVKPDMKPETKPEIKPETTGVTDDVKPVTDDAAAADERSKQDGEIQPQSRQSGESNQKAADNVNAVIHNPEKRAEEKKKNESLFQKILPRALGIASGVTVGVIGAASSLSVLGFPVIPLAGAAVVLGARFVAPRFLNWGTRHDIGVAKNSFAAGEMTREQLDANVRHIEEQYAVAAKFAKRFSTAMSASMAGVSLGIGAIALWDWASHGIKNVAENFGIIKPPEGAPDVSGVNQIMNEKIIIGDKHPFWGSVKVTDNLFANGHAHGWSTVIDGTSYDQEGVVNSVLSQALRAAGHNMTPAVNGPLTETTISKLLEGVPPAKIDLVKQAVEMVLKTKTGGEYETVYPKVMEIISRISK